MTPLPPTSHTVTEVRPPPPSSRDVVYEQPPRRGRRLLQTEQARTSDRIARTVLYRTKEKKNIAGELIENKEHEDKRSQRNSIMDQAKQQAQKDLDDIMKENREEVLRCVTFLFCEGWEFIAAKMEKFNYFVFYFGPELDQVHVRDLEDL